MTSWGEAGGLRSLGKISLWIDMYLKIHTAQLSIIIPAFQRSCKGTMLNFCTAADIPVEPEQSQMQI